MAKKKTASDNPDVHDDLEGFDIQINEFGELSATLGIEKVNQFLNENVEDKKLKNQNTEQTPEEE